MSTEHRAPLVHRPSSTPQVVQARFRGHRRRSFVTSDIGELTEMRARQRTFDGAYVRTALGNLSYALLILKLFSSEFAYIGLLFVILGAIFLAASVLRRRKSVSDFSDDNLPDTFEEERNQDSSRRLWGKKPYRTGGLVILGVSIATFAVEVALFVLILRLDPVASR